MKVKLTMVIIAALIVVIAGVASAFIIEKENTKKSEEPIDDFHLYFYIDYGNGGTSGQHVKPRPTIATVQHDSPIDALKKVTDTEFSANGDIISINGISSDREGEKWVIWGVEKIGKDNERWKLLDSKLGDVTYSYGGTFYLCLTSTDPITNEPGFDPNSLDWGGLIVTID
ncbi:hypothetical protein [Candidatus Methanoplasma termitum]|nr:hypothetical protein [Candidatus Methanoplasma termitum]